MLGRHGHHGADNQQSEQESQQQVALAAVAHEPPEGIDRGGRDDQHRPGAHQVGQQGGVLVGMGGVGAHKAAAVLTKLLDRLEQGDRSAGQQLLAPLQGGDLQRRSQRHRYAAHQQEQSQQQRSRDQHPGERAQQIAMEAADRPATEAADHREAHRQAGGGRHEHQKLHGPQLGQVPQAFFRNQVLLIAVGEKGDRGVERQIPAQAAKTQGVQPGRLHQQERQCQGPEQGIADQQGQQVAHRRVGAAAVVTDPTQQAGFDRVQPAVPGRLGPLVKHVKQMTPQGGSRERNGRQGEGGQQPGEHAGGGGSVASRLGREMPLPQLQKCGDPGAARLRPGHLWRPANTDVARTVGTVTQRAAAAP